MRKPQPLDYGTTASRPSRVDAAEFSGVYGLCVVVGLFALEPALAKALFGRPGDQVVQLAVLMSAAVVTMFVGVLYLAQLKRLRSAYGLAVAAFLGLGAFVPAYVVLFLFFP